MTPATNPVVFRIEWCRKQRQNAHTKPEDEGWRAEEEGLKDALLNRNHTGKYRNAPPNLLERYVLGLQDGQALIRAAWVSHRS